jgi:hypothetical protein
MEVESCPFDGSSGVKLIAVASEYFIKCNLCRATGPANADAGNAVALWNIAIQGERRDNRELQAEVISLQTQVINLQAEVDLGKVAPANVT